MPQNGRECQQLLPSCLLLSIRTNRQKLHRVSCNGMIYSNFSIITKSPTLHSSDSFWVMTSHNGLRRYLKIEHGTSCQERELPSASIGKCTCRPIPLNVMVGTLIYLHTRDCEYARKTVIAMLYHVSVKSHHGCIFAIRADSFRRPFSMF